MDQAAASGGPSKATTGAKDAASVALDADVAADGAGFGPFNPDIFPFNFDSRKVSPESRSPPRAPRPVAPSLSLSPDYSSDAALGFPGLGPPDEDPDFRDIFDGVNTVEKKPHLFTVDPYKTQHGPPSYTPPSYDKPPAYNPPAYEPHEPSYPASYQPPSTYGHPAPVSHYEKPSYKVRKALNTYIYCTLFKYSCSATSIAIKYF